MTTDPYPGRGNEQARQPGGTPAGGRFATLTRREPDVSLANLSDEEYNADGSFEYPPLPRTVEQHVAFWSRVQVPDAVCARVRSAYIEHVTRRRGDLYEAWMKANPVPSRSKAVEEWREAKAAAVAQIDAERPSRVEAVLARPLIRAVQMARYAQWLKEDEFDQVLETPVDIGEERPWTVRETLDYWHLDELPEAAFEDPGSYAGINLAVMRNQLTDLVEILGSDDQR